MTFEQLKEIAGIIGGQLDQAVNVAILAVTGALGFSLKYWSSIRKGSKASVMLAILMLILSAIFGYINKGLLITALMKTAQATAPAKPADLDEVSMFAFLQFSAVIGGLCLIALAAYLSRTELFRRPEGDT